MTLQRTSRKHGCQPSVQCSALFQSGVKPTATRHSLPQNHHGMGIYLPLRNSNLILQISEKNQKIHQKLIGFSLLRIIKSKEVIAHKVIFNSKLAIPGQTLNTANTMKKLNLNLKISINPLEENRVTIIVGISVCVKFFEKPSIS